MDNEHADPPAGSDTDNEYIDYELFTSPEFSPIEFCNSLIIGTNNESDVEIDFEASKQRVQFDLEEVEKLLHREAVEHHSELIQQASKMTAVEEIVDTTRASLSDVTASYQRLENEVLKPYNTALPIYRSLTKFHATSNLLRSLTWYLYLVRQLAIQSGTQDARSSVRAAKTFAELSRHVSNFPLLKNLKVVNDLEVAIRSKDPAMLQ
ncbi:Golgi transport complex subunit 5-domain-containing protein [Lipomyces japonicus]|uniref:Golgi transport complex subunit 5-domain-containing protein n=1 Tax=Lipomyces japonicus TaxID=56871 RepID=UPI0034CD7FF5